MAHSPPIDSKSCGNPNGASENYDGNEKYHRSDKCAQKESSRIFENTLVQLSPSSLLSSFLPSHTPSVLIVKRTPLDEGSIRNRPVLSFERM